MSSRPSVGTRHPQLKVSRRRLCSSAAGLCLCWNAYSLASRADYAGMGKADQFQVLETFLMRDGDETRYDVAAARLGITSGALRMSVHRMRGKYRELLRAEIAETVERPEEIEEEIRFLLSILG